MKCYGSLSHMHSFFTIDYIGTCKLKKLASRKARDLQCINTKMLKQMEKEVHAWISDMFNHTLQCGVLTFFPHSRGGNVVG